MMLPLGQYETMVFDCDGVVLNSNRVKTAAFYHACLPYGLEAAKSMVDYHVANGGVSRYKKFAYFLEHIVPLTAETIQGPSLDDLLQHYAEAVRQGLLSCEIASGLQQLRDMLPNARWLIVSGGDQTELREVFAERGLDGLFNGGIFGSPDTKDDILTRELANENIRKPALFLGDSRYDYQAAVAAGLDFIFLHDWTEVKDWQTWCEALGISTQSSISYLIKENEE